MVNQTSFLNLTEENLEQFAKNEWLILDHEFPESLSELLFAEAEHFQELQFLKAAEVGHGSGQALHNEVRSDQIFWLNPDSLTLTQTFYFEQMIHLMNLLNAAFFMNLKVFEAHGAIYPENSFYTKHRDQFSKDDSRQISVVLYVHPYWQTDWGGELVLYPPGAEDGVRIHPQSHRLVLFRSGLEHEVLPTRAPRFSYTGWFKHLKF